MALTGPTKKILVIDDDDFLREMYKTKLTLENFQVETAENGERALKRLEKIKPDLILLDIYMPKMDGLEVLEKIKSNKTTKNIPVIMLTNLSEKETVDKAFKFGADDYLIKAHFIPAEVIQKVKKYINA